MIISSDDPGLGALLPLLREQRRGVLLTLRADGRPQSSVISYALCPETGEILASLTEGRAKTRNLRRDPRASFQVSATDLGAYLVLDATATLSPVAEDPADATVAELVEVYRAVAGEHPDWDEYRAAMVADRRLVLRLRPERAYGWSPAGGTVGVDLPS
ncbi:PPOX class probable F420-dependent enzyme [Actinoalloteichus hoggarensis]|uniref:Putative pyridoxine/pyridoxamine 5'-phosphate oxidase n=1 Tax=Actinoalloteichus hoggarensis TaxID=1470176 RepID=A0A221W5Y0_9PSEU|nr:PPOX class F420-dependent oxidoreductase [Actinoalloteichus hoggarensis]ASO21009.1 Putative pyridoxine/pyridoxamine 5'-phosphate oxidase [Actinoalloteichus hoggarensis]MBB5920940.1 PPOX class probable F420-dependent enzyme [Actinoalloteichus hoggarensis]